MCQKRTQGCLESLDLQMPVIDTKSPFPIRLGHQDNQRGLWIICHYPNFWIPSYSFLRRQIFVRNDVHGVGPVRVTGIKSTINFPQCFLSSPIGQGKFLVTTMCLVFLQFLNVSPQLSTHQRKNNSLCPGRPLKASDRETDIKERQWMFGMSVYSQYGFRFHNNTFLVFGCCLDVLSLLTLIQ